MRQIPGFFPQAFPVARWRVARRRSLSWPWPPASRSWRRPGGGPRRPGGRVSWHGVHPIAWFIWMVYGKKNIDDYGLGNILGDEKPSWNGVTSHSWMVHGNIDDDYGTSREHQDITLIYGIYHWWWLWEHPWGWTFAPSAMGLEIIP